MHVVVHVIEMIVCSSACNIFFLLLYRQKEYEISVL